MHDRKLNRLSSELESKLRARMLDKIKTDDNFCGDQLESGHFLLYHKVCKQNVNPVLNVSTITRASHC